jgi:hypothetical protein
VSDSDAARRRGEHLTAAQPTAQGLHGTAQALDRLCRAATLDLPASGVAISLHSKTGVSVMAAASDAVSESVEELQFTFGEGPCVDAFTSRRPVLTDDLDAEGASRWPGYSFAAAEHGVRAVFAFPLAVGGSCLGALDVFRTHSGPLSPQAMGGALAFAAHATATLLTGQEQAGPNQPPTGLDDVLASRFEVHQAQGMLTVQLGVGLEEALVRLRAHAFANGRSLAVVARDVLAGILLIERDQP